jgi:hypothetical protein
MLRRILLTNPAGMEISKDGFLEVRGEVESEAAVVVVPAQAAAYLIGGLANLADDYARITQSPQDLAILPLQDAQVESLYSRDSSYMVLRTRAGFQLTFHATLDQMEELGTLLVDAAKRMRTAPPITKN